MHQLKLLGGQTPEELWWLTNSAMPGLMLLVLLPRWKVNRVVSLLSPILMALVYTLGFLSNVLYPEKEFDPNASFFSLEGVMTIFKDEASVFLGWVHYIAFDALVARWVVIDSVEKNASILVHLLVVVPCVFLTVMAGPMGWMMYMILRNFIPLARENKAKVG